MFSFFKRGKSAGKADVTAEIPEQCRATVEGRPHVPPAIVNARRSTRRDDPPTDKTNTLRKDVVNLLIPETDYNQKTGVGAIFQQIMAGKKRRSRNRRNIIRAESCREISPLKETHNVSLQRSRSELDPSHKQSDVTRSADDVTGAVAKNTPDAASALEQHDAEAANFVKALVLQKYANKSPVQPKKQHVSLVYVSNEPDLDEKVHAETLLREIARSIDCTLDDKSDANQSNVMGTSESKAVDRPRVVGRNERRIPEPVYETVEESPKLESYKSFKDDLRGELEKLLQEQEKNTAEEVSRKEINNESVPDNKPLPDILESPLFQRKSNLKPPKPESEVCSDDDRSDCGKKKVTFRKHIIFDDGEQQTDEEVDSSFESLTSSEEDTEEEDCDIPDNDERLGGVVVARNDDKQNQSNKQEQFTESIINSDTGITIKIECSDDGLKRISSDNSDSGFLEISDRNNDSNEDLSCEVKPLVDSGDSESEVTDSEESEDEEISHEEVVIAEIIEPEDYNTKNLVSHDTKFQSQVAQLTELSDARCGESERMRDQICRCRKDIEAKDLEIEHLKCQLASAYKESELIRQRSRSLEEELSAARGCSADLAQQLSKHDDDTERRLQSELENAQTRTAELESRVLALERDRDRLEQEKRVHEQKAQEAVSAAESNTAKWRAAHESARTQAAARAERMLADCEWKMRELEKKARDTDKQNCELTKTIDQLKTAKPEPSATHMAELQQLRGLATEQQRSVQALTLQLQRVETREEALKLEVYRLKELLDKESKMAKEKEDRHWQAIERLAQQHGKALETAKTEHQANAASTRAALERMHAERTRAALSQLRADAERDVKNADRKLREVTTRFDNLKETLSTKERAFDKALCEAHSKADWELMQLRHLLDKADITYANNSEKANEKFELEKESLIVEWSEKLRVLEEESENAAEEARVMLQTTIAKLTAEKTEQVNKLKEQHRKEMDEQWEQFMSDKETCLARMKTECRQEGEEDRVKREKDLLEEIAELKSQLRSSTTDFDTLVVKGAACGRTLAVTEQELKEALAREKGLREKRSEDATKIKQVERASSDQVDHLTRKCACLRKLFDDMRARLASRERAHEQEASAREKEVIHLRAEVARLTKLLKEQGSPKLGARTRADGCDSIQTDEDSFLAAAAPLACETQPNPPRRKGGTLKTPELLRKRTNYPDLAPIPPEARSKLTENESGRRRAKSVDLPAVQVPVRIKQLEGKNH